MKERYNGKEVTGHFYWLIIMVDIKVEQIKV